MLVSGTPHQTKKAGYVAEFCPICREIRPFQLHQVGPADHLHGVSLGMKNVLGHTGTCQHCQTVLPLKIDDYAMAVQKPGSDLDELIRKSFPNIREQRAHRLEMERRAVAGELSPIERRKMLMEPFRILFPVAESLYRGFHLGSRPGVIFMACVVLALAVALVGNSQLTLPDQRALILPVAGGVMGVGVLSLLGLVVMEPGKRFSSRILPSLATALRPLRPSKAELEDCLLRLRRSDFQIGKKAKLEDLWDHVQPNGANFFS